ncbi:MAG: CopD family protein [Pseudomonadota bacterium]
MLMLKVLHIWLVTSWFAGLFYLPRIFVNLALVAADSHAERDRLLLMASKLARFMTPLAILAIASGLWLAVGFAIGGGWLHAKTSLVLLLVGYHLYCRKILSNFKQGKNTRSHIWYRWFNEAPVVLLLAIVFLVIVKPF